ncbi:MAG: alpha/beta hydrolase [Acidimicrobiia bacterium]|nr:alpha/beta hydrolase [Acidimicrobiia bacterium]
MSDAADVDPGRYRLGRTSVRGFEQVFAHEGVGGAGPLVLVHGWPETKRVWWKVIGPLAAAGFEVIVPDLRGFGDSEVGPPGDGFGDVPSHSRDLHALVHDHLGHERAVLVGGDLGGPVIQDLALRFAGFADRMVLFNSPLPYLKEAMEGLRTRPAAEAADYFLRQGTDADNLAGELATPEQRRRYIAAFYSSRFWAHPGTFDGAAVEFHTEPFAAAAKLRAGFRTYESVFDPAARSEPPLLAVNAATRCLVLFGPSDHVLYPTSTGWPPSCSPTTWGPSCCATAATSSRGRHRMRWRPASPRSAPTSSWRRRPGVSLTGHGVAELRGGDARRDRAEGAALARLAGGRGGGPPHRRRGHRAGCRGHEGGAAHHRVGGARTNRPERGGQGPHRRRLQGDRPAQEVADRGPRLARRGHRRQRREAGPRRQEVGGLRDERPDGPHDPQGAAPPLRYRDRAQRGPSDSSERSEAQPSE